MSAVDLHLDDQYKLGDAAPKDRAWSPGKVFCEAKGGNTPCLRIADTHGRLLIGLLSQKMQESFLLLYVLVVTRGEGREGRYQSAEPLTREDLIQFLERFEAFLEKDGRQNLWIKSQPGPEFLVWDRHGLVYAYGFGSDTVAELKHAGWAQVNPAALELPDPHSHHYHAVFDDDAGAILKSREWLHSPLREQDY